MASQVAANITRALDRLEAAIIDASESVGTSIERDPSLVSRIAAYREVVKRQKLLVDDLQKASARRDFNEVRRFANLIQASSMMVKMDLNHILEALKHLKGATGSYDAAA